MTDEKEDEEISTGEAIGWLALEAAGIYLFKKFLEDVKEDKTDVWTCGNCGFILRKRYQNCPNCGVDILWG